MNEQEAVYPIYTENDVYKELAAIAKNAGIKIEYHEKPDENTIGTAKAREYGEPIVTMMANHDYGTQEFAAFALAHEIAHVLTDGFYGDGAQHFYRDKMHVRCFVEADADKVGAALYSLAEMTAIYKAESVLHDTEEV